MNTTDNTLIAVRMLRDPAGLYRESMLRHSSPSMWQQVFLNLFVIGCLVSVAASGRFSIRLIADGAVSFAFVPVFQISAFALVWAIAGARSRFLDSAGIFLSGGLPWLAWEIALIAVTCFVSPIEVGQWIGPDRLWLLIVSAVPFALWSAWLDFHFYREVLQRSRKSALRDLLVQRAMAWSVEVIYFFAFAIPPALLRRLS